MKKITTNIYRDIHDIIHKKIQNKLITHLYNHTFTKLRTAIFDNVCVNTYRETRSHFKFKTRDNAKL